MRSRQQTRRCVRTLATLFALAALTWSGVALVRAAPARADVSLARGWVHLPAVAPGLVFTGAPDDAQLVAGGPGLVAYEQQVGGLRIHTSATGRSWARLPGPTFGPGALVNQLLVVGQQFIIPGRTPSTRGFVPRIWASVNGGRTWKESPAKLQISAVTPGARALSRL